MKRLICVLIIILATVGLGFPEDVTLQTTIGMEFGLSFQVMPSTGQQWMIKELDESIICLLEPPYFEQSPELPEGYEYQIFRFRSIKIGRTTIVLERRRPWEEKVYETFTLIVVIKEFNKIKE